MVINESRADLNRTVFNGDDLRIPARTSGAEDVAFSAYSRLHEWLIRLPASVPVPFDGYHNLNASDPNTVDKHYHQSWVGLWEFDRRRQQKRRDRIAAEIREQVVNKSCAATLRSLSAVRNSSLASLELATEVLWWGRAVVQRVTDEAQVSC
jgi:hypothetical protein